MTRDEAATILARAALGQLPAVQREAIVEEWRDHAAELGLAVEPDLDPNAPAFDLLVLHALAEGFQDVSNAYLSDRLRTLGQPAAIDDAEPSLLPCRCCGYATLRRRAEYDVCPVCLWEDDGVEDVAAQSAPNHMTLEQGRRNFARFGACSPELAAHLDPQRLQKYLSPRPAS